MNIHLKRHLFSHQALLPLMAAASSICLTANVVVPGPIETDLSGGLVRDNAQMKAFVSGQTVLGRAGVPDDIGGPIASLLSEDNRWINGRRIEASGGMFL